MKINLGLRDLGKLSGGSSIWHNNWNMGKDLVDRTEETYFKVKIKEKNSEQWYKVGDMLYLHW